MADLIQANFGAGGTAVNETSAGGCVAGPHSSDEPEQVSSCVVIPDFANTRFKVVTRGSLEHKQAFRFLRNRGILDRYCERYPTFLPLKGRD
jgi:hypothetical protein